MAITLSCARAHSKTAQRRSSLFRSDKPLRLRSPLSCAGSVQCILQAVNSADVPVLLTRGQLAFVAFSSAVVGVVLGVLAMAVGT